MYVCVCVCLCEFKFNFTHIFFFFFAKSLQSCPILGDPIDGSPPGSSIHRIFQARVLEWGAIAFNWIRYINKTGKNASLINIY